MSSTTQRLVKNLVTFECNATILKDAINVGSKNILLLPYNDHLMITTDDGIFTCFKLMSSECFLEYKLETQILDEWYNKQMVDKLKVVVFAKEGLIKLLEKMKRVKITIEEPIDGDVRYIHVDDLVEAGETSFSGKIQLMEKEFTPDRLLTRFVEYFDSKSVMIPKPIFDEAGDFHLFKIREGGVFSPIVIKDEYQQFITSIISITPDEFEIQVFNSSTTGGEFKTKYTFDFIQSTNEENIQKNKKHENTVLCFPANPATMEQVIKYQSGQITHIFVKEENDPVVPFFVIFCSLKDMGDGGKIYTSSILFLETQNIDNRPKIEVQGE